MARCHRNTGKLRSSAYHRVIPVIANAFRLLRGHRRKCDVGRRSDRPSALDAKDARPRALFGVSIAGAALTRLERRAEDCGDEQSGQQGPRQD
ncbi:hypothetical protein S23_57380 [Bradyrhizobium cosmicum]|uniref:Uncharacterized protein n=1 Tax=Bradyrhizobium cosmicum TaxID=1404864 RepID=A0AAI8MI65_9BRAD|nr:hypothetical protein S23_57380 [Bradyrhizobium cosmicum]